MTTLDQAKNRLDELTAQISILVRTVSVGVLAVVWLFLSGSLTGSALVRAVPVWALFGIALLSILSISFDLLQYVAGYKAVSLAREQAIADKAEEVKYPNNFYRKARFFFFRAKFWTACVAALWLVCTLGTAIAAHFCA